MEHAINEIKVQAKKLLQAKKSNKLISKRLEKQFLKISLHTDQSWQLKHCLLVIARDLGFQSWQEAQQVLSGQEDSFDNTNFGNIFYPSQCFAFINEWFSTYEEAQEVLMAATTKKWLLPYKSQYFLVEQDYIDALGLSVDACHMAQKINRDFVLGYDTETWDSLVCDVIRARSL